MASKTNRISDPDNKSKPAFNFVVSYTMKGITVTQRVSISVSAKQELLFRKICRQNGVKPLSLLKKWYSQSFGVVDFKDITSIKTIEGKTKELITEIDSASGLNYHERSPYFDKKIKDYIENQ